MLPLIIGAGITIGAITIRTTVNAFKRYARLSPTMIARMNDIVLPGMAGPKSDLQLRFAQFPGGFQRAMTETEALLIFEVSEDEIRHLNKDLVKKRHRKLMLLNHPDKGGSPYVAAKLNQAKEILDKSALLKN